MTTIIGFCEKVKKRFTCYYCGAIVEYTPKEDQSDTGYLTSKDGFKFRKV